MVLCVCGGCSTRRRDALHAPCLGAVVRIPVPEQPRPGGGVVHQVHGLRGSVGLRVPCASGAQMCTGVGLHVLQVRCIDVFRI